MTRKFTLQSILAALTMLLSTNALAIDVEELIEARQGLMKLYAINVDLLGDMIRGSIRYDQKKAQYIANNLQALASMNHSALWPRGSSLADRGLGDKTSAKPDIWRNRQDVSQYALELATATEVLAKNAGWSVDALEENIKDVNLACKGCHRKYRAKQ